MIPQLFFSFFSTSKQKETIIIWFSYPFFHCIDILMRNDETMPFFNGGGNSSQAK